MLRWVRIKHVRIRREREREQKERQKRQTERQRERERQTATVRQVHVLRWTCFSTGSVWCIKYELTMWLLIGPILISVFRAAYCWQLSMGSSYVCVSRGSASRMPQPFREQLSTRTAEYQWVGLKRHGSSWKRLSFSRTPSPGLHGLIFKATS